MRRLLQLILLVLTVSFAAFLVERSCHNQGKENDPYRTGGVTQAIPPAEKDQQQVSASRPPQDDDKHPSQEMAAKKAPSAQPHVESTPAAEAKAEGTPVREVATAAAPRTEVVTEDGSAGIVATRPNANVTRTGVAAARTYRAAANDQLQGTWVLTDANTRLQLTVVSNTGVLEGYISEAGKSITVEQTVRVSGGSSIVYVYGSDSRTRDSNVAGRDAGEKPIVLAFNFKADGSAQVVWRRGNEGLSYPLVVVSHVR